MVVKLVSGAMPGCSVVKYLCKAIAPEITISNTAAIVIKSTCFGRCHASRPPIHREAICNGEIIRLPFPYARQAWLLAKRERNWKRSNADAIREHEPKIKDALGPPPSRLSGSEKTAWREMAKEGYWLTGADEFMVEIASSLMAKHRANEIDNPARSLLVSTLAKLGFGPTERSQIKVLAKKESTDFDDFL